MAAPATFDLSRQQLKSRIAEARARTDELFGIVLPEAISDRPIPERHRVIFYLGHLEAFDWNLLAQRAFGLAAFHPAFDRLFAFGIDPVGGGLPDDKPQDWPARTEIEAYNHRLRDALDGAIERWSRTPSSGHPQTALLLEVAIEHRLMHAETLAYMLHQLPPERKVSQPVRPAPGGRGVRSATVQIPEGRATLGQHRVPGGFGWDNEFEAHTLEVPAFRIDAFPVTNGEFLKFVQAGGYHNRPLWSDADWAWKESRQIQHPAFWLRNGNLWMYRGMFAEIRLPLDWPVYVSHAEASAYARWLSKSLPTEAQFHRAAYGTPDGGEHSYPWGEEPPSAERGNFDFYRWDPTPVGAHPAGASAFGVEDLLGNGWEWTRTAFRPFEGFRPFGFYPGYSADFFDGKHFVMKGGSARTAACLLRRSFRNWFQPHYQYVYAGFRCVQE
jgi:iron(II)-dependent oxidoreductase